MGGVFSSPKPAAPPPPPPAPTQDDASVKAAAEAEKKRLANAKGRQDSILTTAEGDVSEAVVKKNQLLGG